MKKIFFLVIVLICWMGNVWGQQLVLVEQVPAKCVGDKGKLFLNIENLPSSQYSYTVVVKRGASQATSIVYANKPIDENTNLPFVIEVNHHAQYYYVYLEENSTMISPTLIFQFLPLSGNRLDFRGDPDFIVICPDPVAGSNIGNIKINIQASLAPYTYVIVDNEGIEKSHSGELQSFYTFEKIPREKIYSVYVEDARGCQTEIKTELGFKPFEDLSATIQYDKKQVSCIGDEDGKVKINVFGGVKQYWYELFLNDVYDDAYLVDEFPGLPPGNHHIIINDDEGCWIREDFEIIEPSAPTATIINPITHPCPGEPTGAFTIEGFGGTPGYHFTINNVETKPGNPQAQFTGLSQGVYTVTGEDANTCNITISNSPVTLTDLPPVRFTASPTNLGCAGVADGKITITNPSYPAAQMQYKLEKEENGNRTTIKGYGTGMVFDGLLAGNYIVTGKNTAGCEWEHPAIIITEPTPIQVNVGPSTEILLSCNYSGPINIMLTGSGTSHPSNQYRFRIKNDGENWEVPDQWYNANNIRFQNLNDGIYWVQARENNSPWCQSVPVKVTITRPGPLELALESTDKASCAGIADGTITFSVNGGTEPYTFTLNGDPQTPVSIGDSKYMFKVSGSATPSPTQYAIRVIDKNICTQSPNPLYASVGIATPINAVIEHEPVTCADLKGTLTVNVTQEPGWDLEFFYMKDESGGWVPNSSHEINNLDAGNYKIKAKYTNDLITACAWEGTKTIVIPNPVRFELTDSTSIVCHNGENGTIEVTASGGFDHIDAIYEFNISKNPSSWVPGNKDKHIHQFIGLTGDVTYTIKVRKVYGSDICYAPETETKTKKLGNPPALEITNVQITNISCPGLVYHAQGEIKVITTGGTEPLQFTLSKVGDLSFTPKIQNTGLFDNLQKGTYKIEVDGCQGSLIDGSIIVLNNIIVTQPEPVIFTAKANELPCANLTTSITVTIDESMDDSKDYVYRLYNKNDNSPITDWLRYSESRIIPNIGKGNYYVLMTYAGKEEFCTGHAKEEVTVSVSTEDPVKINGTKNACFGDDNVEIVVTPAQSLLDVSNVTYKLYYRPDEETEWAEFRTLNSSQLTVGGQKGGWYKVIASVSGCEFSDEVNLSDPPEIIVTILESIHPCGAGMYDGLIHFEATGGVGTYTYELYRASGNNYQNTNRSNSDGRFSDLRNGTYAVIVKDSNTPQCVTNYLPPTGSILTIPSPLVATINPGDVTHVLCNGAKTGSAKVEVEGGNGKMNYKWFKWIGGNVVNPNDLTNWDQMAGFDKEEATSLFAGTYKVIVTDICGTSAFDTVEITQPDAIDITYVTKDITCNGASDGYIKITVSGGVQPYTYKLNGVKYTPDTNSDDYEKTEDYEIFEIFGLGKGDYTVEVTDANNCEESDDISIFELPALMVTITPSPINCFGNDGKITVNITGGQSPYLITVYEIEDVDGQNPVGIETLDFEGSVDIDISMFGVDEDTHKQYRVVVIDNMTCSKSKLVSLFTPEKLVVKLEVLRNICPGSAFLGRLEPTTIGAGGGSNNYYWYKKNEVGIFVFEPSLSIGNAYRNVAEGEYYVKAIDGNGCEGTSNEVTIFKFEPLNIDKYESYGVTSCPDDKSGSVQIFNPSGGISGDTYAYQVFDKDGNLMQVDWDGNLDGDLITGLPKGEYYIIMKRDAEVDECNLTLRIPKNPAKYITIDTKIKIEIVKLVYPDCNDPMAERYIEFEIPWNSNLAVDCTNTKEKPYFKGFNAETQRLIYHADLIGSGETVITVDDGNDCPVEETVIIPESLSFSWEPVDDKCEAITNITFTFAGGEAPYTLVFDSEIYTTGPNETSLIISDVSAGEDHYVEITYANCNNPISETIKLPEPIKLTAVTSDIRDASCSDKEDGYIRLSSSEPYIFTWPEDVNSEKLGMGDYTVTISHPDGSCPKDEVFTIDATYSIEAKINRSDSDGDDVHFCPGELIQLSGEVNASAGCIPEAKWILPNNVEVSWNEQPSLELTGKGTVTLMATITVPTGTCSSSDKINVVLNSAPTLSFTDSIIFIPKGIVDYQLIVDAREYEKYEWTASTNQIPSLPQWPGEPSPSPVTLSSPVAPYKLTLTLTGKSGCWTKQDFYVDYTLDLLIPNVFTPGRGSVDNQTWKFREIEKWTSTFDIQVEVYTRNGALVYSAKGYDNVNVVWDGRRNGENVPLGTYYYIVRLVPKSSSNVTPLRPINGSVTINR